MNEDGGPLSLPENGNLAVKDRRSDQSKVPTVYFNLITFPDGAGEPRIKIGESGQHRKRRQQLAKSVLGIRFDVVELAVVRGTRADEQQLLRHFEPHKIVGEEETFWPVEQLTDYIRWLRDQYFVWVPDDDKCPAIEQLDAVEYSQWMPTADRCKPVPPQKDLPHGPLCFGPREVTVDDFYTGTEIIACAHAALGAIDLDPASHAYANRVVGAQQFYTINDDGLKKPWQGRVWLNPPFSQWQAWGPKILAEWASQRVAAMLVLCATRTLTAQYMKAIHRNCQAICILNRRFAFWGGHATSSPDDGHAIFYFGREVSKFADAFESIGTVYHSLPTSK